MIKNFLKSVKRILLPYVKAISLIIITSILLILIFESADLINQPSTIKVVIGLCGIGVVIVFIYQFIKNKINQNKEKETEKNEG